MGPIRCPETSVPSYHSMVCKIIEERRSLSHLGESLKSRMKNLFPINEPLKYLTSIFGKYSTIDKIIYCKVHLLLTFMGLCIVRIFQYTGSAKKFIHNLTKEKSMLYVSIKFNYTSQVEYKLQ